MPSYFFHLALELYPYPVPTPKNDSDIRTDRQTIYVPAPGTDIFRNHLPAHKVSAWKPCRSQKEERRRKETDSGELCHGGGVIEGEGHSSIEASAAHAFAASTYPATRPSNSAAARDWRYGAIAIESIDMEAQPAAPDGRARGKSLSNGKAASANLPTKGRFVPSNPKNTDVGWGVVHLYRESHEMPGLYDATPWSSGSENGAPGVGEGGDATDFKEEECTTLCILAVPSYMMPSDLLGFVGEQTREDVSNFRLIRTGRANKYMVLMKFREAKKAREWRKEWDGKLFNSMEPENCHVVFVKSVEFQTPEGTEPSSFPDMTNDPFTPASQPHTTAAITTNSPDTSVTSKSLTTKPLAPPTPALVELPTCPVCLERMDETTGLLTILCQHVFHCACLYKWRGSGCPVCRYTQSSSSPAHADEDVENECSVCGTTQNLWICLICGNTGCGRYDSAHAYAHYEATSHAYAMDVSTQHVWDYAGDGYVHRLIANKADGKLVDLPFGSSAGVNGRRAAPHPNSAFTACADDSVPREKMENMANEYAYLLTSQLEGQRAYFAEQLERAVDKAALTSSAADAAAASASTAATALATLAAELDAQRAATAATSKALDRAAARADKADRLARDLAR
ncbi:hypothetical protein LTR04_003904, partial [Oleoguttula sp. CCFEE 6159]